MEHNPYETLADIARPKTPNGRGRKRNRGLSNPPSVVTTQLDEERARLVEKLFENARNNIGKIEEGKTIKKAAKQEVFAPKVKFIDGKMVIDRESMVSACVQTKVDTTEFVKVKESGIRSSVSKKKHNERWNEEETQLFYTALQLFGTDFELISNFMKNRNRSQIKSKYKKESKLNPLRIDHAIWNRIPLSKEAYADYIKAFKDLGNPPDQ